MRCRPGAEDCVGESRFAREDGAWLRILVDPPRAPTADAVVRARVAGDGRLLVDLPGGADRRRVVAVTARAGGHDYAVVAASGVERDLAARDLATILEGVRLR
jgi:hypothetical protein